MAINYEITISGPGGCNAEVKAIIYHALDRAGYAVGKITDEVDGNEILAEHEIKPRHGSPYQYTLNVHHMPWGG